MAKKNEKKEVEKKVEEQEAVQAEFEIVEPDLTEPSFEVVTDENGVQKVHITGFLDPEVTAEEIAGKEVSVRKTVVLGSGKININELTAYVKNKVAEVNDMDVATADEADVKAAQVTLNRMSKELNDARIALSKVWAEPFDDNIANPIKNLVNYIEKEKAPIAKKLADIVKAFQDARKKEIEKAKTERLSKESEEADKFIRSLPWFDDERWLNKGATPKKIATDIDAKTMQIVSDIDALGMLNADDPFGPQLMEEYRINGGNLATTILKKRELEEAAARFARIEEERKARLAAEKEARRLAEEEARAKREAAQASSGFADGGIVIGTPDPPSFMGSRVDEPERVVDLPPVVDMTEKKYEITFKIQSTKRQVANIISRMKDLGVVYSLVEQKEI